MWAGLSASRDALVVKMAVLIETSVGDLVVDLYTKERPKTCLNFLKLCKLKYYNYCLFYNVQNSFVAQTGDPTATGEGGKSVWGVLDGEECRYVECEVVPRLKHAKLGTISMVTNDSNNFTSQFFFTLRENLDYLDGKHCVFGEVAEGHDVLEKLSKSPVDKNGRPLQDICILHTVILDDPYPDPPGLIAPSRSPSPPHTLTDANHIGIDEDIDEFEGKTATEVQEAIAQKESKANAHILEMVGDIPDADAKPPENVLFVCKLNPATSSEDLEIIFSRFGSILSCEVIRDQKTGDSLQYAFIEFENEDDCIKAYFKMDNVLIDDRRIHVDFSQSLAKTKYMKPTIPGQPPSEQYEMVFDNNELMSSEKVRDKQRKGHHKGDHRHPPSSPRPKKGTSDAQRNSCSPRRRHRDRSHERKDKEKQRSSRSPKRKKEYRSRRRSSSHSPKRRKHHRH